MSYINAVRYDDSPSIDAFARLRVSNPLTIFDSKQIFDSSPLFWDDAQTSGSGTGTAYNTNQASTTISVGASTAGTRVRQTKRRFNYQPAKSQLILLTGVFGAGATGITRRMGYFDDSNGLFFQLSGATLSVVRRTFTSGSAVDNVTTQANWNLDKLDGTGASGIILDTSKTNIFLIDFEWLGVGRVRYGVVIDGIPVYCHEINNANALTVVYMSTPNLPLRYEISNDGTGGAASLVHICSSVISEGGQEFTGVVRSANNGSTQLDANVVGTVYAAIGMRLKTTHLGATVFNIDMSMLGATVNDNFLWELRWNPTVAGTFTYNAITDGAIELALGATANTVTGGLILNSGYAQAQTSTSNVLINSLNLGATIAGVRDEVVLCVMPLGANLDIFSSVTWRELL
jgi:hypothetical protein